MMRALRRVLVTIVTGRAPNVEKLNLAAAGVAVDATKGHILADEWQVRSNI